MAGPAAAIFEVRLLFEAPRLVDDAFPVGIADREADGGAGRAGLAVLEDFLGEGAAQEAHVQPALVRQVGFGRRVGVGFGGRKPLRPVFEQFGQQVADAVFPSASIEAAAFDHLRIDRGSEGFVLPALRAFALLQPAAADLLEPEFALQAFDDVIGQVHRVAASSRASAM